MITAIDPDNLKDTTMLNIAVVTGGHNYDVRPFHHLFRSMPGIDAYVQHLDDYFSSPREVRLNYDAVVLYIMPKGAPTDEAPWYSGKPKSVLEQLGETAQGIVVLHHSILAYPDWPVFDEMVGMHNRKIRKYKHDEQIAIDVANATHPIVQGMSPWTTIDETYTVHEPDPGNDILLTTKHPESMHSIAWTRSYRNSRVFCFQCGHDRKAYEDLNFRAVLQNGIHWVSQSSQSACP
ncbi:MAG: ThuA domain-containing protein [Phycisphaerales bacterium]|nr:ThuA domain-containing protein [Phycisphaerales bacterium]